MIDLDSVSTHDQFADHIPTKSLGCVKFQELRAQIGVVELI